MPALIVVFPLEGSPVALVDALTDGEEARLRDWLGSSATMREAIEELAGEIAADCRA